MILVALTDIHGDTSRLAAISADLATADIVLLTGDLTHFGDREAAAQVVDAVRQYNPHILAVPGNCDQRQVAGYLTDEGINLHARHIVMRGLAFVGVGGSLPAPGRTPNEYGEEELGDLLQQATEGLPESIPWILVCHQPPYNTTTDLARIGRHVGSKTIRHFIETRQPLICFTGHIHEGYGLDSIGHTQIINPGPLRHGGYAYAQIIGDQVTLEVRE